MTTTDDRGDRSLASGLFEALDPTGQSAQLGARLGERAPQLPVSWGRRGIRDEVAARAGDRESFVTQALECALGCREGNTARLGQLAAGRQAIADGELAGRYLCAQRIGQLLKRRARVLGCCHATRLRRPPREAAKGGPRTL